jgi:hypothetical protein
MQSCMAAEMLGERSRSSFPSSLQRWTPTCCPNGYPHQVYRSTSGRWSNTRPELVCLIAFMLLSLMIVCASACRPCSRRAPWHRCCGTCSGRATARRFRLGTTRDKVLRGDDPARRTRCDIVAAACLRLHAGEQESRYTAPASLPWPQEHSAHGAHTKLSPDRARWVAANP